MLKNRIWPIIGVFALLLVWVVSALANFTAGLSLADDPAISLVLGAASVASDILKAVALFLVVGAIAYRRWVAASVAVILFVLCSAWSLRSAVYFATDALTDKSSRIERDNTVAMATLQLVDIKSRRAEFLAEQKVDVTGGPRQRAVSVEANKASAVEFNTLVKQLESDVAALKTVRINAAVDPVAALFEIDPKQVAIATSLLFAVLLELASSTGFWLMTRARYHPEDGTRAPLPIPTESSPPVLIASPPVETAQETPTGYGEAGFGPPTRMEGDNPPTQVSLPPATEPEQAQNVVPIKDVDRDALRLDMVLREILEPGSGDDRVLLSTLMLKVNEKLPRAKKLTQKHQMGGVLAPALNRIFPAFEKRKVSGQIWACGVRLRTASESVKLAGTARQ